MAILNGNGVDGGVEEVLEQERARVSEGRFDPLAGLLRWVLVDEIEESELVGDRRFQWLHHFWFLQGFSCWFLR